MLVAVAGFNTGFDTFVLALANSIRIVVDSSGSNRTPCNSDFVVSACSLVSNVTNATGCKRNYNIIYTYYVCIYILYIFYYNIIFQQLFRNKRLELEKYLLPFDENFYPFLRIFNVENKMPDGTSN